jgi:integrase
MGAMGFPKRREEGVEEALAKYNSIKRLQSYFIEKRGVDAGTPSFYSYAIVVLEFCSFINKTPDQVIEEVKAGRLTIYNPETEEGVLQDYKLSLLQRKVSSIALRSIIAFIKTWLKVNGVKVDLTNFTLPKAKIREKDNIPRDEELKLLMENATLRMRTAIAILASSGIRVSALLGLKLKDLRVDFDKVNGITKIVVPEHLSKNGQSYVTFMSSEATKLLKQYLVYRKKALHENITEESYVIVSGKGEKLSYVAFREAWKRLLKKCGLANKSHKFYVYHIHVLRKWFRTKAEELTPSVREKLMGHVGGYLDESYFRVTDEQLLEEYKKIHAFLLIQEGVSSTLQVLKKDTKLRDAIIERLIYEVFHNENKTELKRISNEVKRNPENAYKLILSKLEKTD